MGLWDRITTFFALEPWQEPALRVRTGDSVDDLIARLTVPSAAWTPASIREALAVPAIFGAVSLISNTVGALSVETFRDGVKMLPADRPRIVVRPDPFSRPREFYRDSAYNLATRGEAWWWTAKRDVDGTPLSVLQMPPAEVTIEQNTADLRYPVITWRGKRMPNADVTQITYIREPGDLRGRGPLQMCGAAVSVSVEAQEWAANFYSTGGNPSLILRSDVDLEQAEANELRTRWMAIPNNTPHVITPGVNVDEFGKNGESQGMLQSRDHNVGEVARMFVVPASLLAYATPGSSLTYQNVSQELDKFTRTCLWPFYLEPIEQAMTDLLTRSTTARFNVDGLLRADIKTRAEVYQILQPLGVLTAQEVRIAEGYAPGDVERAPVPFAQPSAVPDSIPAVRSDDGRCPSCRKRIANRFGAGYDGDCPRCKQPIRVAVARSEAPVVNLTPHFDINVPAQASPQVNIAAPIVNVSPPEVIIRPPTPITRNVIRDEKGFIIQVAEEVAS